MKASHHSVLSRTGPHCALPLSLWGSRGTGASRRRPARCVKSVHSDEAGMTLQEIKVRLGAAVQSEDYQAAAHLRDVLAEKELDSKLAVEHANQEFYRAFEMGSLVEMKKVWGKGDHVQCIHPGQGCIAGYDMVLESWEVVLSSFAKGSFEIVVQDVRVYTGDDQAFVTCTEMVKSGLDVGMLTATNLFEKQQGQWVIIHHHASSGRM